MTEEFVMEYYEDHDEHDYILIGNIELFDDYYVESVIGTLDLKKKAKVVTIEMYTKEGWENPHLHLYNDHFQCAIRLDTNKYFIHGKYKDTLNNQQAKLFDDFMRGKDANVDISRWTLVKYEFNREFPKYPIKISEQPNYAMLNYNKCQY